mgnify:CR=1 FL=1
MKDKLVTSSYCFILAANFLLYFGFWLLIPVLPFYLSEVFSAGNSTIGIILSCYTVAALCIRPFSGYFLDSFARKPLYLMAYFIFMTMFAGYIIAGSLTLFIMFRIIQGVSFGMVTVGGNTVVIDIMPSSRRGEGLGYYGLSNNIAMAVGPMSGLFLHDAGMSFTTIFCCSLGSCMAGFVCASLVKTPYKPPVRREPISLDRFILLKGIPAGISLLLLSIPYGMTTNYVAMYAKQIGINATTGFFFTFMAIGMAISRIFSGKIVDRGKITQVISAGLYGHLAYLFRKTGGSRKNNTSNNSRIIPGCLQFLPAFSVCISYQLEQHGMYDCFLFRGLVAGSGVRHYVPRLQHFICQPRPQQPTWYRHFYLPDLLGCRHRYRYVDRRLYCRSQHL